MKLKPLNKKVSVRFFFSPSVGGEVARVEGRYEESGK